MKDCRLMLQAVLSFILKKILVLIYSTYHSVLVSPELCVGNKEYEFS